MMQRTKIVAEDSREAMARIMRDFGEDAVILSTRNVPGGIEIVAGHPAKGTPKFDVDDEEPTLARLKKAQKKQQADVIAERTSDVLKKTGTSKSASQKFADILLESGTTAPLPHAEGILYDQHQCNDKQQPQQPSAIGLCVNPLAIADAEDRRADRGGRRRSDLPGGAGPVLPRDGRDADARAAEARDHDLGPSGRGDDGPARAARRLTAAPADPAAQRSRTGRPFFTTVPTRSAPGQ